jgi:hypothetical protein
MFWRQEFSTFGNDVLFRLFLDYYTPTSPLRVKRMYKANLPNMVNQSELTVCHLTSLLSKLVLFLSFLVSIAVESAFKMPRQCINSPYRFRYVCGEYAVISHRQSVTPLVKKAYFGCKLTDQDKKWAHICCTNCASRLRGF